MLLHPTYSKRSQKDIGVDSALKVAEELLAQNGMSDIEAYVHDNERSPDSDTPGYYLFSYRNKKSPNVQYGGGAYLIVRITDGLAGMLHYNMDFMYPDLPGLCLAIAQAYEQYPVNAWE
jgi:hypothetical protein